MSQGPGVGQSRDAPRVDPWILVAGFPAQAVGTRANAASLLVEAPFNVISSVTTVLLDMWLCFILGLPCCRLPRRVILSLPGVRISTGKEGVTLRLGSTFRHPAVHGYGAKLGFSSRWLPLVGVLFVLCVGRTVCHCLSLVADLEAHSSASSVSTLHSDGRIARLLAYLLPS